MANSINGVAVPADPTVCIVGGGITGALVALRLGQTGIKTVIIEAGRRFDPALGIERMQQLLAGIDPWKTDEPERDAYVNAGPINYPLNRTRVKGVGGSTLHWAGYTPRFVENDFRMRSRYGISDDWPISYAELEPYYVEAENELGVAGTPDNPFAGPRSAGFPLAGFPFGYDDRFLVDAGQKLGIVFHNLPQARTSETHRGRPRCVTFSACKACPIRARYSGDIHVELAEATGHVTVIPNTSVVRLVANGPNRRIHEAIIATKNGVRHAIRAPVFVVAAHAVESARLLLMSSDNTFPAGLANSSGLVGRYFMEHRSQHQIATLPYPLFPFRKGFATAFSQQFHDAPWRGEGSGLTISGQSVGGSFAHHLRDIATRTGFWGESFAREIEERIAEDYGRQYLIRSHVEPLPSPNNRIELDSELKDTFGNPVPRLNYSISDYEEASLARGSDFIVNLAEAMNAEFVSQPAFHFGSHHAGTCRMGSDPQRSVVDRNLRSHDHPNLFIAGSSNFVSLSLVNPTLTISALALRLGRYLADRQHRTLD